MSERTPYSRITLHISPDQRFISIPQSASVDLDPYEYRLLAHYIQIAAENDGKCDESIKTTASRTKISMGKVSGVRHALIKKGYIKPIVPTIQDGDKCGYVYLIRSSSGYYKIGRTKNPSDRIRTFSVKLPFEVEYICLIATNYMYSLEADLHTQFKHKRINGEWFDLTDSDVSYIKSLESNNE